MLAQHRVEPLLRALAVGDLQLLPLGKLGEILLNRAAAGEIRVHLALHSGDDALEVDNLRKIRGGDPDRLAQARLEILMCGRAESILHHPPRLGETGEEAFGGRLEGGFARRLDPRPVARYRLPRQRRRRRVRHRSLRGVHREPVGRDAPIAPHPPQRHTNRRKDEND